MCYASLRTAKYQFVKNFTVTLTEATKLLAGSMQFNWGENKQENVNIKTEENVWAA